MSAGHDHSLRRRFNSVFTIGIVLNIAFAEPGFDA